MALPSPTYLINPKFRLNVPNLRVEWHLVDADVLDAEACVEMPGRHVFRHRGRAIQLVQWSGPIVDMIYHSGTDFATRGFQKWLREVFRDIIFARAQEILPGRVKHFENLFGMYGSGVSIARLRKTVIAQCSGDNHITLQPFLILFKQEWIDETIMHEMAHYIHKNHRKPFWNLLSKMLGRDARASKTGKDIEMSPYYGYCLYLTR